jgi:hypothetical protein
MAGSGIIPAADPSHTAYGESEPRTAALDAAARR